MSLAGIYVRISEDRGGAGLGVARQQADCEALCQRKGWDIAEVYVDNDTSAYSGAPRPGWEQLTRDARAGVISAIACWHVDRLTRTPRELEDVIDLADKLGLQLGTVTGEIDLATPTGRLVARMLGAAARHESEHKAERQRREHRQRAEAGKVAGGGYRPFGYADDRVTILDNEAALIRECAARALSGESLSSICRDLSTRGVQTTTGRHFVPTTLRNLLCSARISGRREHIPRHSYRGKARPKVGEIVADAVWPAIIAPEHSDRLRALLTRPERLKRTAATGRSYLLSGIFRCGRCGSGMVGRPRSGVPRYVCPNTPGGTSCGGLATNAERTDDLIRDMVLTALASPDLAERLRKRDDHDPDLAERIRRAEDKLSELAADYAADEITRSEWRAAREVLERQLQRDRDALARVTRTHALDGFTGTPDDLLRRWRAQNVSQRRALVGAIVERINVRTADPRKRWDPERFEVIWRA